MILKRRSERFKGGGKLVQLSRKEKGKMRRLLTNFGDIRSQTCLACPKGRTICQKREGMCGGRTVSVGKGPRAVRDRRTGPAPSGLAKKGGKCKKGRFKQETDQKTLTAASRNGTSVN